MPIPLALLDSISLRQLRDTLRRVTALHVMAAREPMRVAGLRDVASGAPLAQALEGPPLPV